MLPTFWNLHDDLTIDKGQNLPIGIFVSQPVLPYRNHAADEKIPLPYHIVNDHRRFSGADLYFNNLSVLRRNHVGNPVCPAATTAPAKILPHLHMCDRSYHIDGYPGNLIGRKQKLILKHIKVHPPERGSNTKPVIGQHLHNLPIFQFFVARHFDRPHNTAGKICQHRKNQCPYENPPPLSIPMPQSGKSSRLTHTYRN